MIEWMVAILGQIHISIITLFLDTISGICRHMVIPHSPWPIVLNFAPDRLRLFYKQKFSNLNHIPHRVMLWYPSVPLIVLSSAYWMGISGSPQRRNIGSPTVHIVYIRQMSLPSRLNLQRVYLEQVFSEPPAGQVPSLHIEEREIPLIAFSLYY